MQVQLTPVQQQIQPIAPATEEAVPTLPAQPTHLVHKPHQGAEIQQNALELDEQESPEKSEQSEEHDEFSEYEDDVEESYEADMGQPTQGDTANSVHSSVNEAPQDNTLVVGLYGSPEIVLAQIPNTQAKGTSTNNPKKKGHTSKYDKGFATKGGCAPSTRPKRK
ncbi:hypothetical protein Droror1_Dr00024328 [Drosera rotundifolia]